EMSFVTQEDVFAAVEPVLHGVFEEFGQGRAVTPPPFPRISYAEAALKYGTDKPDLRNPLVIADVSEVFAASKFRAFRRVVESGGVVRAIPAPGSASRPRSSFQDRMDAWAKTEMGAPGLGYIILENDGSDLVGRGPIANNLEPDEVRRIATLAGLGGGD